MNDETLQNLKGNERPVGPYSLGQGTKQRHGSAAPNNDKEHSENARLMSMSTRHFSSIKSRALTSPIRDTTP